MNFWQGFTNKCSRSATSCLKHLQNGCFRDGTYVVNNLKVTCSMSTGGGQLVSQSTLDMSKILAGKQYPVFLPDTTFISSYEGMVPANTVVKGIFSIASPKLNYLTGKTELKTTNNTVCHSSPALCYNYMGTHNWFTLKGIGMQIPDFGIVVYSNGVINKITAASDGTTVGSEHAYIYTYRPSPANSYNLYELP